MIILVGVSMGSYTPGDGTREITLALPFTPRLDELAYIFNVTQNRTYHAPALDMAKCTLGGAGDLVITIDAAEPVLATTDVIHIQLWYPGFSYDFASNADKSIIVDFEGTNVAVATSTKQLPDGHAVSNTVLTNAVDGITTAIKIVDYVHHEIHDGSYFEYVNAQELTNAQTVSFVVVTPDTTKWAHFGFMVEGKAEFDIQVFEAATPTANGTIVSAPAVINANRNVSDVHTTMIYHTPTLGGGSKGTLIRRWHSGSGKSSGGTAGTPSEIILKQNTKYWFDLTNATTSNNWVSWVVGFYEHTNA